ncbi:hypothetical protein KIW84_045609 [Lathyrus oleraceus]|uniref:BAR domain-containing protein n=1 Tax=Pisum sativum TaxID=3888 RepID=A0A9D5ARZ8_PEA|nr:hypothetical protein KIW84_045609 [Pisum sativum]
MSYPDFDPEKKTFPNHSLFKSFRAAESPSPQRLGFSHLSGSKESRRRFDKSVQSYDQSREKFISLKKNIPEDIVADLEQGLQDSKSSFEKSRSNLVHSLVNIEVKKKHEFLESISATMDAHCPLKSEELLIGTPQIAATNVNRRSEHGGFQLSIVLRLSKRHRQSSHEHSVADERVQVIGQCSDYKPPPNSSGCARSEPYDYSGRRGRKEPEVLAASSLKRLFVENQPYLVGGYCQHGLLNDVVDSADNILSVPEKYKYMKETCWKQLAFGKSRIHGFGIFAKHPYKGFVPVPNISNLKLPLLLHVPLVLAKFWHVTICWLSPSLSLKHPGLPRGNLSSFPNKPAISQQSLFHLQKPQQQIGKNMTASKKLTVTADNCLAPHSRRYNGVLIVMFTSVDDEDAVIVIG